MLNTNINGNVDIKDVQAAEEIIKVNGFDNEEQYKRCLAKAKEWSKRVNDVCVDEYTFDVEFAGGYTLCMSTFGWWIDTNDSCCISGEEFPDILYIIDAYNDREFNEYISDYKEVA